MIRNELVEEQRINSRGFLDSQNQQSQTSVFPSNSFPDACRVKHTDKSWSLLISAKSFPQITHNL